MSDGIELSKIVITGIILFANSITDIKRKEILPSFAIFASICGMLIRVFLFKESLIVAAASLIPGMCILLAAILLKDGIGKGDALIIFAAGSWMGFFAVFQMLMLGLGAAACYGGVLWIKKRKNMEIPFVPFLSAGFLLYLIMMSG